MNHVAKHEVHLQASIGLEDGVIAVPLGMPLLATPKGALIAFGTSDIELFDAVSISASSSTTRAKGTIVAGKSKVVHISLYFVIWV